METLRYEIRNYPLHVEPLAILDGKAKRRAKRKNIPNKLGYIGRINYVCAINKQLN